MSSNYPPGVTGTEDYFMDDDEMKIRRLRKSPTAKQIKAAAKAQLDEIEKRKAVKRPKGKP